MSICEKKLARAEQKISILEEMIEKTTRELFLANKDLSRQIQKLKEINYTQSHDLRAPLSKILGTLHYLRDHDQFEDYKQMLPFINEAAQELDKTIIAIVHKTELEENELN